MSIKMILLCTAVGLFSAVPPNSPLGFLFFSPFFFFGLSRVTVIQLQILDESPEDRSAGKWFSRHAKNPY